MNVDMMIRGHGFGDRRADGEQHRGRRQRGGEFQTHIKYPGRKRGRSDRPL
ncbi:hypothetical protein D3C87_1392000 [compost metagenome]